MTDIKTVLPKPRIHIDAFGDITPVTGNAHFVTGDFYDADQMREAIERAVLEAAPASSAMAMQAVDVPLMAHKLNKCKLEENHSSHGRTAYWCTMYRELCEEIIDALQSQQSPVQASDAGRQG